MISHQWCAFSLKHRARRLTRACAVAFAVLASGVGTAPVGATENGLSHYPLGVNSVLPALDPPPGKTEFYDYTQYYEAGKFVDASGKSVVPHFHLSVFVDAVHILHTYNFSAGHGHFTFSSGVVQPVVNSRFKRPGMGKALPGSPIPRCSRCLRTM